MPLECALFWVAYQQSQDAGDCVFCGKDSENVDRGM
jgi:hypothetical protein